MATKERNIVVEGHTDSRGSEKHNLDLSQRRADSVRSYLVARGYEADRMQARGIGKGRPTTSNDTAEGRANNRRVEIIVQPVTK
jgi:outer membrane protein OmpA-like peptidoglycan-associated protein